MMTPDQLAAHWTVVGGSASPAVVGVDPYRSPYQLARQYLFPEERPDLGDNEAVYWGNALEDAIARAAAERHGWRIKRTARQWRKGWMGGFPDRLIVGAREGLEVKNRSAWKLEDYRDGPLPTEIVQCQHYLAITGFEKWWLAVLVGGQKLLTFPIERNQRLIDDLVIACDAFGEQVIGRKELPPPQTAMDLALAYPRHDPGKTLNVSPESELALTVEELAGQYAHIAKLEGEAAEMEARIKAEMGTAERLTTLAGKPLASWKTQTSNRLDTARLKIELPEVVQHFTNKIESRVFRLLKEKA